MLTPDGPKVIEYNCRFGDPETQVVLPLLQSDLLQVMTACTEGTLADTEVQFADGAAACVILASGGYPVQYEKGKPITGLTEGQLPEAGGHGLSFRHRSGCRRPPCYRRRAGAGRDRCGRCPARCSDQGLCRSRADRF